MRYKKIDDLIRFLRLKTDMEATRELTRFFADARFGLRGEDFTHHYCDGADDGGIDLFNAEDKTFYVIQSKFSATPRQTGDDAVLHELRKLGKTLASHNPNKKADEFVNAFRRAVEDEDALLEIIWLTTNEVRQSTAELAQQELVAIRKQYNWKLGVDFVAFGNNALERMIFDIAHGYVPYTGKKEIMISGGPGRYIESRGGQAGIYSVVCSVKACDMLKWIDRRVGVNKFLQKNVREYVGDTRINKEIQKSFLGAADWFWYKHNGIIIFADSVSIPPDEDRLIMRNPQIVNGGQTLTTLYEAYDRSGRKDSTAEVLVRAYRLPYERTETYERSIEIIKGLNSQNAIRSSDLHSTDPRQVRLQFLLGELGYKYLRKRAKEAKSGEFSITMRNLALYYYICKKRVPHEGVLGQIEEIFDEKSTYNEAFPEDAIDRDLNSINHIVLSYILVWRLAEILDKFSRDLPKRDRELSYYTFYFVLVDLCDKIQNWRASGFKMTGWRNWKLFIESEQLKESLWEYVKKTFHIASNIVPRDEEPRKFFKKKEATQRFASEAPSMRRLNAILNRAYDAFERTQECE